MNLGVFSMSLAVKDIKVSREFYEKFGFTVLDGKEEEKWLILKNGDTKIGIFQDMFESNILTWNPKAADIRNMQKELKEKGVKFLTEADETTTGPAHFTLKDPDGNAIMVDAF